MYEVNKIKCNEQPRVNVPFLCTLLPYGKENTKHHGILIYKEDGNYLHINGENVAEDFSFAFADWYEIRDIHYLD